MEDGFGAKPLKEIYKYGVQRTLLPRLPLHNLHNQHDQTVQLVNRLLHLRTIGSIYLS